ncbi:MAG: rod shape-determining protein MreC [Candidatus Omnitrophica bacterium]|nr:rod shape-determining protein MreC [Candidatus Omnitrophota bacterium]
MFKLKKQLIFPVIFVAFLFFLSFSISSLRALQLNSFNPVLGILALIQRETGGIIFYHRNLIQNEKLEKEIDFLRNRVNTLNEFYLENNRLKNILSLKQKSPLRVITARVITRSTENWSSSLIIDKGSYNGIRQGMTVMTYLGLAGRIIDTTDSTSKVILINDPALGISALVQRSRQEGLVCGTLGANLMMKYLPEEADIKPQDIIITSGLNQTFPKGLLIGRVIETGKEFSGLSRYAIIKPAVNLANIEEVLVVIP